MSDPEFDDWLGGLSGERPPRAAGDEGAALREVILSKQLVGRLRQEGLLPEQQVASNVVPLRAPRTGLRQYVAPRVLAMAATVAFLAIGVGVLLRTAHPELTEEQMRGVVGGVALKSAQPQQTAAAVERELRAIGLEARHVDDNKRLVLEVTVTEEQLPAFNTWMEAHGGAARAVGEYRIAIDAQP